MLADYQVTHVRVLKVEVRFSVYSLTIQFKTL